MSITLTAAQVYWDIRSKMPQFPYAEMVIVDRIELWRPKTKTEEPHHVETIVLYRADTKHFIMKSPFQYKDSAEVYFTDGEIRNVVEDHVFPCMTGNRIAKTEENRYVELPYCTEYDFREGPGGIFPRDAFAYQYRLIEPLLRRPHPNVTAFFGCRNDWYWINGLVFGKYSRSLAEFKPDEVKALNAAEVVKGIESGVQHLHNLCIMHLAIYPQNIRFDGRGRPVIVNFRNADGGGNQMTRESIDLIERSWAIYGVRGSQKPLSWNPIKLLEGTDKNETRADFEVDWYGVLVIGDFLRYPEEYQDMNKPCRKIWWDCRKKGHLGLTCCMIYGRDNLEDIPDDDEEEGEQETDQGTAQGTGTRTPHLSESESEDENGDESNDDSEDGFVDDAEPCR